MQSFVEAITELYQPVLRPATLADCPRLAELIEIAGEGIPTYIWSQAAAPGQRPLDIGIERAARPDANFSYNNTVVAEDNGAVIAMVLAYRLAAEEADLDALPALLRPLVELEMQVPDTFYINALAALPEYRDRSFGSMLLDAANTMALAAGCGELSVEVFSQNRAALRLYQRHGYRIVDRRPIVAHPCYPYDEEVVLMTRPVIF
jgi:ribosomal protein S18 acetylase RimI-like enzyme